MSKDREELYRFVQNETNFMLLTKSEFKGNEYFDIRKYFINEKGQEIATKKGLMLSMEDWLKVIEILNEFFGSIGVDDWEASSSTPKKEEKPDVSDFDFSALDNVKVDIPNPFNDDDLPFF